VVERGVGSGLDEEAIRVLKLAPAWKPGIQNGKPVRVKFTLPISFMIPDSE
jgi:protein TonB